jgi:hypothetical protein
LSALPVVVRLVQLDHLGEDTYGSVHLAPAPDAGPPSAFMTVRLDESDDDGERMARFLTDPNICKGQAMEDAGPFLDAVDASEVPDYYDVIKVPLRLCPGCPQRP